MKATERFSTQKSTATVRFNKIRQMNGLLAGVLMLAALMMPSALKAATLTNWNISSGNTSRSINCGTDYTMTISAPKSTAYDAYCVITGSRPNCPITITLTSNSIGRSENHVYTYEGSGTGGTRLSSWTTGTATNTTVTSTNGVITIRFDKDDTKNSSRSFSIKIRQECCCNERTGTFSFSQTSMLYNILTGGDFAEPTLTNTLTPAGTATYSSSNTAVATVNATTGAVTIVGTGTVTITATIPEADGYCEKTASYTITVTDGCTQIGSKTSTTADYPVRTGSKNSYEQMIFTAAELGNASGSISAVSWYSNAANTVTRSVDIYMGETTNATFANNNAWIPAEDLTLVYSGEWTIRAGWNEFPVVFYYSGTKNLVIAVDCGSTTAATSNFRYSATTGSTVIAAYSDVFDATPSNIGSYLGTKEVKTYRPNTKICITPCELAPTFAFANSIGMCYLGGNCPMLPLTNTSTATPTFTSSNTSVATVAADGSITTLSMGRTTITADIEVDGRYCPARASYLLEIICPAQVPFTHDTLLCLGPTVTLEARGHNNTDELHWFDVIDATTPVHVGPTYSPDIFETQTYYVASYDATYDCYSPRVPATAEIFRVDYDASTLDISGYVGVPMYGQAPGGTHMNATYTATGMPGWMHLNPDGSFYGTPTATGEGTFTITGTNSIGCVVTNTTHWTVTENTLSCCDLEAFYLYQDGIQFPIQQNTDGYFYVNACKDEETTFRITPLANCTGYSYRWRLASYTGGILDEQTGTSFSYTFDRAMGYNIMLTISKTSSPTCSLSIPIRVRVAGLFQVSSRSQFDLCEGEAPFNIYVSTDGIGSVDVIRPDGSSGTTMGIADTIFLPDGIKCDINGELSCAYTSSVTFTDFSSDATIRDANDLLFIKLNIEHSYIGDIFISLTCPNGTQVSIMNYGGTGTSECLESIPNLFRGWNPTTGIARVVAFGDANDCTNTTNGYTGDNTTYKCDGTRNKPGVGWNYCWSQNTTRGYTYATSTNSKVYETANHNSRTTCMTSVDSSDMENMRQIYKPDGNFNNFIGCPLNGEWTITVMDGWSQDNGYIFGWELGLNEELLPDNWSYSVDIDSAWVDCGWYTTKSGTYMEITPPEGWTGSTDCDLNIRDEYGCISRYSDIVTVNMHESGHNTDQVGPVCDSYTWERTGQTYTESGTYVDQQLTAYGCPDRDTLILDLKKKVFDTVGQDACQSYTWTQTGQTYTTSGLYTDTIGNGASNGCDSIVTMNLNIQSVIKTTKDTLVCPGSYPLTWRGATFTGAGRDTLTYTSVQGCDSLLILIVATAPKPEITLIPPDEDCPLASGEDYTVSATVTGGTTPYSSYVWSGAASGTGTTATIASDGTCKTYTEQLILTDKNGCKDTATTTFSSVDTQKPTFARTSLSIPALTTGSDCEYTVPNVTDTVGVSDNCELASVTQSPTAGTTITGATTVTVTATDMCGNSQTTTVGITIPTHVSATVTVPTTNQCPIAAGNNYTVSASAANGTAPYTYAWSDDASGSTTSTTITSDGKCHTYLATVIVTDANGCKDTTSGTFVSTDTQNPTFARTSLSIPALTTGSDCEYEVPNVTDTVGASDNCTLATVTQSPAAGTTITSATTVTVTATDMCGNTATTSVSITIPTHVVATVTVPTTNQCPIAAGSNYTVSASASNGTTPYTYLWSDSTSGTAASATITSDGKCHTYLATIIVTDANGCKDTTSGTFASVDTQDPTFARNSLSIPALTTGSNCEYTIPNVTDTVGASDNCTLASVTQSPAAGTTITSATTVTVTATDMCGNTATTSVSITVPTHVTATVTVPTSGQCPLAAGNNYTILASVSDGNSPYTYQWSDSTSGSSISTTITSDGKCHTYLATFMVTDANGCKDTVSETFNSADTQDPTFARNSLSLPALATDSDCEYEIPSVTDTVGASDNCTLASVTQSPAAGTTITSATTVTVTATDMCGNTATTSVSITLPDNMTANITNTDVACNGGNNGTITVSNVAGGTAPYTYHWSNDASTLNLTNLSAGTYTLTITDANGCQLEKTATISEAGSLVADTATTPATCFGDTDGTATLTSVTGGTYPYTYAWTGSTATDSLRTDLAAGTYTVTITDHEGCTLTKQLVVKQPDTLAVSITVPASGNCPIAVNSKYNISSYVSGGTSDYTYLWSDSTAGTADTAYIVSDGKCHSYAATVTVTDAHNCTASDSKTFTIVDTEDPTFDNPQTTYDAIATGTNCEYKVPNMIAIMQPADNCQIADTIQTPAAGSVITSNTTVTVTATDMCGNSTSQEVLITVPNSITFDTVHTDVTCFNGNDGSITISNAAGGDGTFNYSIGGSSQTTGTFTGLAANTYTATVTDANNCSASKTVTISQPDQLSVDITVPASGNCPITVGSTYDISASVSGGTSSYTYLWSDSTAGTANTTNIVSDGKCHSYKATITVTDAHGCTASDSKTFTIVNTEVPSFDNPQTTYDAIATGANCEYKVPNMIAIMQPTDNCQIADTVQTPAAGSIITGNTTVTVTVTDMCGNTTTQDVLITVPVSITFDTSHTDISCYNLNDGTITISNAAGGNGTFSYTIGGTTQTTGIFTGLTANTYTATVTDANNCSASKTIIITQPDTLTVTIIVPASDNCPINAGSTYDISTSVSGGTSDHTYLWSDSTSGTANTANIISDGKCHTYAATVTVTDAHNCTASDTKTFTVVDTESPTFDNPQTTYSATPTGANCEYRVPNMIAVMQPSDNCRIKDSVQSPMAGTIITETTTVTVTVTDMCGNTATQDITITVPNQITFDTAHTDATCYAASNGTITISNVVGGNTPYSYSIGGVAQSNGDFAGLAADSYTASVTDANGCSATKQIVISRPTEMSITEMTAMHQNIDCHGNSIGKFMVAATGGVQPYTYTLGSNTNATGVFTNLTAGTYTVAAKDANYCEITIDVTITEPDPITLTESIADHINVDCFGNHTGCVTVIADGGTPGYTYTLGETTNTTGIFCGLAKGTYTISAKDIYNCPTTIDVDITQPTVLSSSITPTYLLCKSDNTGSIDLTVSGGVLPYTYLWSNGATSEDLEGIAAGVYSVTTTDSNGCTIQNSTVVFEPDGMTLTPSEGETICLNTSTSISVSVTGGTSPYRYLWNNGNDNASQTVNPSTTTTYVVTVTDGNNCPMQDSVTITVNQPTQGIDIHDECDSYLWPVNGITYINSNNTAHYLYPNGNANGCDSTVTLNLTIRYSSTGTQVADVCDTYTWIRSDGTERTYTASNNTDTYHTTNEVGCDSTTTLDLTIRYSTIGIDNQDHCDSCRWTGGTGLWYYNSTDEPTSTFVNGNTVGCDSTTNLHLIIRRSNEGIDQQSACDMYLWAHNNNYYSISTNEPSVTLPNANAVHCDSTVHLHLTIRYSNTGTDYQEHCDTYTWPTNGETYTESTNLPTVTLPGANVDGCDSTVTLNLIIHYGDTIVDDTAYFCENMNYTWNGYTYDTAGTYQMIFPNRWGCDSVAIITLIVYDTTHVYVYDTCIMKELPWTYNDRSYDYSIQDDLFYLVDVNGCDSIVHYNLEAQYKCDEFLQFPTVVTPNGDGINDRFVIVNLIEENCYPKNRLIIYNRWGMKVFEAVNIEKEEDFWDPSTEDTPEGTYFFRFDGVGFDIKVERKGAIEVIKEQ